MSAQGDVVHFDRFFDRRLKCGAAMAQEELGLLFEFLGILGGEIMGAAALGAALLYLGMMVEIAAQRTGYIFALRHDANAGGMYCRILGSSSG